MNEAENETANKIPMAAQYLHLGVVSAKDVGSKKQMMPSCMPCFQAVMEPLVPNEGIKSIQKKPTTVNNCQTEAIESSMLMLKLGKSWKTDSSMMLVRTPGMTPQISTMLHHAPDWNSVLSFEPNACSVGAVNSRN